MTNSFLRNLILSFSFLILGIKANAQFSKTHYIPPITAFDHSNATPQDQYLYISTPSIAPVNIKITPIGGSIINATASKSSPYRYSIGSGFDTQLFVHEDLTNRTYSDKGYVIEAEDLVYVTLKLNGGNNAQAGALVSKGIAGLGKEFRTGGFYNPNITEASMNFISLMATENNTIITISNLPSGTSYIANSGQGNNDIQIKLNNGESYVVAAKNSATPTTQANSDAFVGALITSDKLIAVNCGSLNGTNSVSSGSRDYGFDQIVPIERIGNEYIFTRAFGNDEMENPIIVAHENGTQVYIQDINTPYATLNAGEYVAIQGDKYSSSFAGGNLYVRTTKNVFAYQGVGGTTSAANQGLFFVPPLNCETPIVVDNIPLIDEIGDRIFEGGLSVLTKLNADLKINDIDISSLGGGTTVTGPTAVAGKTDYVTYLIEGLSGNVSIESTKEVYVAAFGYNGSASFGGYYSGFSIKPEVFFDSALSSDGCLPGVKLGLNSLTSFDEFQWYKDGVKIDGETNISYDPTVPGYYQVEGKILCSNTSLFSDNIPVSNCTERDIYDIPRNIDLDYDNDGILNCTESLGEFPFDLNNTAGGNFISGTYTYDYNVTPINTAASTPFSGNNDGVFSMEVPAGVTNAVVYESNFNSPLNIKIKYPETSISSDSEFTSEEHFIINVPKDQTITIYNPDDQLLIDTNYDGIYESGITEFSAFEVRIKSNATSIVFGTGTFSISAYQVESIKVTLINDSDFETNKASLQILTSCIPLDSDNDGIPDYLDLDSDNDGIPDITEAQAVIATNTPSTTDTNKDGLFDIFETSSQNIIDSDLDTVLDYLDLDSDNDGIYDLFEADHSALDINLDGIIDGNNLFFGTNGLSNSLETSADNGIINYSINDSNSNTFPNSVELDSDSDGCNDVIEAGFSDLNGNGLLGDGTPTTNLKGIVTSRTDGYSFPNSDYTVSAPLEITKQPIDKTICELKTASFSITSNSTDIQWQMSNNGTNWVDLTDDITYSGVNSDELIISNISSNLNDFNFRAVLNKTGNTCGLISDTSILTVYNNPVISVNNKTICIGDSIDLSSIVSTTEANIEYEYYEDDKTTIITNTNINPTITSSYFFIAKNALTNCQTEFLEIVITVNPIPNITLTNVEICAEDSINLESLVTTTDTNIEYDFYQNDKITVITDTTINPIITTSYFVIAKNTNTNCETDFQEIVITVNPLPSVTITNDEICINDSINLESLVTTTDTNVQFEYYESDKTTIITNTIVAPTSSSSYFVIAKNTKCTTDFLEIVITVNPLPNITITNGEICEEDSLNLESLVTTIDTNIEYDYYLNDKTTIISDTNVNPKTTTSYFVIAKNTNTNCETDFQEIVITVNPLPNVTITNDEICINDSINLESLVTTTDTNIQFEYYESDKTTIITNTNVTPVATSSYFVIAKNTECETDFLEIVITVNPLPNISITNKPICIGDSIKLEDLITTTDSNIEYEYYENDKTTIIIDPNVNPTITTSYFVIAKNTNTGCKTDFEEITITINELPNFTISNDEICVGDSIELNSLVRTTDSDIEYDFYQNDKTTIITETNVSPTTTTSYFVISKNKITNCETDFQEIIITVNSLPNVTITNDEICINESIDLKSLVATTDIDLEYNYYTSDKTTVITNTNVAPTATSSYFVNIKNTITNCETGFLEIIIMVNPLPNITITNKPICIGDSIKLEDLITTTDSNIEYEYYENDKTTIITDSNVSPTITTSYFVIAKNTNTECETGFQEIIITVVPLPTLSPVTIIQCDDETSDGFTFFNLRIKEEEISANYTTETFTYYITKEGAENKDETQKISDPIAYKNQTINTDVVWLHVENENGCEQVTQIDLAVSTTDIPNDFEITYDTCDDFLDIDGNDSVNNDDTDGVTLFNFSDATAKIRALLPVGQTLTITYFRNEADGLAERNPIDPNAYRNIGYANLQYIYVRVDSDINNDCLGFGPHIKLTVDPIPNFNTVENIQLCDDNTDGYIADFDLESKTTEILGSQSNIDFNVTYHRTIDDANTGNNSISSPYTNETRERQTIFVRVINNATNCPNPHGRFDIIVNPLPTFTNIPTYEVCDDETVDGLVSAFDLNSKIPDILGTSQKEEDFIVTFHETQAQAESNSDAIPDVIFTNTTAWNQTLHLRIENKLTGCTTEQGTIDLKVNQKPEFTVEENQILCIDNPDGLDLTITSSLDSYQYEWFDSKGNSIGTGETIKVYQGDTYKVIATIAASPECPVPEYIFVKESSAPTIVNFKVTDGFNLGTILVLVDGIGEFEYQINGGDFQAEPLFENLLTGTHSITVNDKNGCGSDTKLDITVLIFDKYFTPNNDGHGKNEWGIDIDPTKYKTGAIKIFDRSGRLLKNMNPLSTNSNENSWDGTFNGKIMPATDYWFSLELTDNKGETIVKTGNFSLVL